MKNILLVTALSISASLHSFAFPNKQELPAGYYMVVAAYAPTAENYAIKLVGGLKEKGIEAGYGFSSSKNLYFVYSASYSSKSEAINAIMSERERTGEDKAWVYMYKTNDDSFVAKDTVDGTNETSEIEKIDAGSDTEEASVTPTTEVEKEEVEAKVEEDVVETPVSHQGMTYLYIEALDATSGEPVTIDFEVIDLTRKKEIARTHSNHSFPLKEPNSASKMIQVQTNDIAWQPQSFDFKYYEPIIDPISIFLDNLGDTTFVKFEMKPVKKGDIITLYKVFFFKDAAIMMEKSKYELDQVVAMMKNNPTKKIILHGHTNGNAGGKIIALKDRDDVDFFNIHGDHRELAGTAKQLSKERASIVGRYLEEQGVSADRYEIEGWGGKKMIYDKHSPDARYNVRVEVEVVEE